MSRRSFVERHEVAVDAAPEEAVRAAREVTLRELPLVRVLTRLRGMPPTRGGLLDVLLRSGFRLVEDTPTRVVAEAWGTPWKLRGGIGDTSGVLMRLELWAEPGRLVTATTVEASDAAAARRFARYWLVIRPFSGLIRRLWLRAAARRL